MSNDSLLRRACTDDAAFAELVRPYRRELHVHCYRMLGSFDDAEDAVQETLLAAWRGLAAFQGEASLRTWLYRIATNTCLNLLRSASRRPQKAETLSAAAAISTGSTEITWLQPYPDVLLDTLPDAAPGPDVVVEQVEAVSLAFVTALQLLSPRARAVLVLRDVLGMTAREVAVALDTSAEAVAVTLSRARAALRDQHRPTRNDAKDEAELVRRLTTALTAHDVHAVVRLLAEDVRITMPPLPAVWQGRETASRFLTEVVFRLVPRARFVTTHANRQPALGVYTPDATTGAWRASGLLVITLDGSRISGLTRFESTTLRPFALPRILRDAPPPARPASSTPRPS